MSQKLLQVNFKFSMSRAEYEQACLPEAPNLANVPGLRWKVWIMNEAEREAGGIYLFDDEFSVQSFVGPLTGMLDAPAFSDVRIKTFDILEALTLITRGPVQEAARTRSVPSAE
jgi:hypothetical protein